MKEENEKSTELKQNEPQTEVKTKEEKTTKKGKKVILITAIIVISVLIISLITAGVFFAINFLGEQKDEKKEIEWGDAYLEILNDEDKIEDMDNLQIQLVDLDLNNIPELIIYGIKNSKDYIATIYKINDEKKIDTVKVSLDKEFDLKYLYNSNNDNYKWYAVENTESSSKKSSSTNNSGNISNSAETSTANKIYDIHIDDKKYEPELTQLKIGVDCIEIEENYSKKVDFSKNASEDDIKKIFDEAKEGYVSSSDMITEKVKNKVENFKIVKNIKKVDQSKELVYTVNSFKNNNISMKYPAINIDSNDVKQINKEIEEKFGFKLASGSSEQKYTSIMEQGFMETEVESYEYYVNGTILSLVPFSAGNDSLWAKTYNVDLKTQNKISGEDVLKINNLDKDEVVKRSKEEAQKALEQEMENDKKKMGSYYDEMFGGANNKSKQINEWKANLDKSIENLNVFQNGNGEICLLAEYEHFGGQWTCTKTIIINVTNNYTVSNFESEMLGTTKITETIWHFEENNTKQETNPTTTTKETKTESTNTTSTEDKKASTTNNTQSSTSTGKKVSEGKYKRNNTGTLEISNVTGNSFQFSFECYYFGSHPDAPNIGMVSGTAKATSNGNYQYEKTDEYGYYELIKFNISDNGKITVQDQNKDKSGKTVENPYCGFNVTLDGEYVK